MRQLAPRGIVILQDDREKNPLTFPKHISYYADGGEKILPVSVEKKRLATGDYTLRGYEHLMLLERKAGINEVWNNTCTEDQWRFGRMMRRLSAECRRPLMLLMETPDAFLCPTEHVPDPQKALDRLIMLCAGLRISYMMVRPPNTVKGRIGLGEAVLRWMLAESKAASQMIAGIQTKGEING